MLVKELDGVHVIELAGRIDVTSSPELERVCNSLIDAGQYEIICDFSCNEYVSSMGLRVFLSTLKRTRKAGGNLVLCCLKPGISEIFDMTGLTGIFPIYATIEAALAFFPARPARNQAAKDENKPNKIEGIIIDKQPKEATHAYLIAVRQGRMDEKA